MITNNRPMVKETITEHKYMNCETKEICWFDLSTGPKWFETTHYPVNDETRTREVERPMNDTEYIEYLEKQNQELKEMLSDIRKDKETLYTQAYVDNLKREIQELKGDLIIKDTVIKSKELESKKDTNKEIEELKEFAKKYVDLFDMKAKENQELKEWKIKSLEESIERINAYKFNLMYQKDELIKIVNSVLENNSKEIEYGQISNAQIIEKIEKAMKEIEYE